MRMRQQGATTPEALAARFVGLLAAQDVDAVVSLYADDAVVSLPHGREAAGPGAIRLAYARALADGVARGIQTTIEPRVVIAGSLAMTSFTGTDARVRTLLARREPDGSWLWVRDGSTLRHLVGAPEVAATRRGDEPDREVDADPHAEVNVALLV